MAPAANSLVTDTLVQKRMSIFWSRGSAYLGGNSGPTGLCNPPLLSSIRRLAGLFRRGASPVAECASVKVSLSSDIFTGEELMSSNFSSEDEDDEPDGGSSQVCTCPDLPMEVFLSVTVLKVGYATGWRTNSSNSRFV